MIVLRFAVFAVVVGLAIAAGVRTGWSQTFGKGKCLDIHCKTLPDSPDYQTCGGTPQNPKKCIFNIKIQQGRLIYCDETTGNCELENGPITNFCTGGCEGNLGNSCFSIFYNQCKSPTKQE